MSVARSNSQIDKPQCGRPKRDELPDVNINIGAQSINSERVSLKFRVNLRFRDKMEKWCTSSCKRTTNRIGDLFIYEPIKTLKVMSHP